MAEGFDVEVAGRHDNYALRFEGTLEVDRRRRVHVPPRLGRRQQALRRRQARRRQRRHPPQLPEGRPESDSTRGGTRWSSASSRGAARRSWTSSTKARASRGGRSPRRSCPPDGAEAGRPRAELDPVRGRPGEGREGPGAVRLGRLRLVPPAQGGGQGDRASSPPRSRWPSSRPDAGCLAAEPPKGVPDYDLSPRQRAAIAAGPEGPAEQAAPTTARRSRRTLGGLQLLRLPRPRRRGRGRGGAQLGVRDHPEGDGRRGAHPAAPDRGRRQADRGAGSSTSWPTAPRTALTC